MGPIALARQAFSADSVSLPRRIRDFRMRLPGEVFQPTGSASGG